MENDSALKVYSIGPDHLVALGIDDAWAVWCEHHGEKREDYHESDMGEVAGETVLSAFVSERGEISDCGPGVMHLPASSWARREGRGFLFSHEF